MIATSVTLHPEWGAEHRKIDARVDPACGALTVEVSEGNARMAVYGPPSVVLDILDELKSAAKAALILDAHRVAVDAQVEVARDRMETEADERAALSGAQV